MEAVTILAMGFVCVACFLMGAKVGQTVAKGEAVTLPSFNPAQAMEERREKKEEKKEQERMDVILQNIENYDGTGYGQRDVPGR